MSNPLDSPHAAETKPAALAIAIFLLLWLPAALLSRGFPEADGCSHYLLSRFALAIPANLTDVWGRPVCTILYTLPAVLGGRFGVCVASALVAIGCGVVAFQIARDQGDRPALAMIFTLAQPWLFLHSLSAMTELPFALLLGLAFLALERKRWIVAALLCGLLPLSRPEGFGFLVIATCAMALLAPRRYLALLPLPLVLWDVAGWWQCGSQGHWWKWLPDHWPYSVGGVAAHGNALAFVARLPVVVSPFVLPATLIGIGKSFRPARIARMATALIALFVLAAHTLIYVTGKMGSYGEARYLLIAAPFWGVLSARGWEWCFARFRWNNSLRWAAVAALAPLLINLALPVVPLKLDPQWAVAQRVAQWYTGSAERQRYPLLLCSHIGVWYYADISPCDNQRAGEWDRQAILAVPPKTLLIWEPTFGPRNATADRTVTLEQIVQAGWIEDTAAEATLHLTDWHVFHSRP